MCVGPIVGKKKTVESVKPKFKVGDKVRVTSKRSGASFHLHDRICTILRMSDNAEAAVLVEEGPGGGGVWLDEIELVTEEPKVRPRFKVGDRVLCIDNNLVEELLTVGHMYTIREITDCGSIIFAGGQYFSPTRFELVSTTGTNPTDEDLLQIIRDAQLAYKTLSEKKVLESDSTGTYRICHGEFHKVNFRLLTKPSLEPFKLPDSGYQVFLRGDVLDIGCKKYDLYTVQTALLTLLVYNESTAQVGVSVFQASKNGVKEGGSFLSWTDAETLYSKIKDLK